MASSQITEFLSTCPSPESGCFANDAGALDSMLYIDDFVIRADFQRVSNAAIDGAIEGIPIEAVTYKPATLEIIGESTHTDFMGDPFAVAHAEVGSSLELRPILQEGKDDIAKLRQRIARCAYVCGATAIGCPLRTAPESSSQS